MHYVTVGLLCIRVTLRYKAHLSFVFDKHSIYRYDKALMYEYSVIFQFLVFTQKLTKKFRSFQIHKLG